MKEKINSILNKEILNKEDIIFLLGLDLETASETLHKKAYEVKLKYVGKNIYYRGLIEYSNICAKDCLYCGIRKDNSNVSRYTLTDEEVFEAADFAWKNKYASIVIQSGELFSKKFTDKISYLLEEIQRRTNNELRITLSCGEQSEEVYRQWHQSGAKRYLLRIEASNKDLYNKIHPNDHLHDYNNRIDSIKSLQNTGFQTGTGVMIGLPFQTAEDLADDLLFIKNNDIDMVGMGPYIEHKDTPLYDNTEDCLPLKDRFNLTLNMIAILRIMMKDINIASATSLQAIDPRGREKGMSVGCNVIMPNVTPTKHRENYFLYDGKPCANDTAEECKGCLTKRISSVGDEIAYGKWGDSKHYNERKKQSEK